MRFLLSEARRYAAGLARAARSGWDEFFFEPASPTALGLVRIGVGLLALWSLFVLGLDLHDYFGRDGWADPAVIRLGQRPWSWSFWFYVPDTALRPVWALCLAVLALFALGLRGRTTALASWIIVVSTVRRVPIALYGFDQVISPLLLYIAATGTGGQALSLDRLWQRRGARGGAANAPAISRGADGLGLAPMPTVSANLALRLVQLHLVLIYAQAGLGKLQGPSWWNGMAIWRTMVTGEFVLLDFSSLVDWTWTVNALTHATVALELLYPVLIWPRWTRPLILAGAFFMHAGIAIMSPGLAEFALAMLTANLAFVPGEWIDRLLRSSRPDRTRVERQGPRPSEERRRSSIGH